ncbi:endosialin [Pogona vitticeps]
MGAPPPVRRPTTTATMLLLLFFFLLAWPLRAEEDPPGIICWPDGCFAAFFQRRTFLEAWRGCRELGGDLAALKRPEEAAQVSQLLLGSASDADAAVRDPHQPRRLLWIGLQRPPRQCHPGRPLRGFAWTTGDQETAYTNWARPAVGAGGCSAPRCVVLDERDLRWLDGSCTVPVDGYLCRFAFPGMCPGLSDGGDEDEDAAAKVRYSTPFGPADGRLRFVPFGTVAAVACPGGTTTGGAVSALCLQTEEGEVGWSKEPPLCPEEEAPAYPSGGCEGDNGGCHQLCLDEGPGYSCECHAGYYLLPDGHSCAAHNACLGRPCQFGCVPATDEGGVGVGTAGYQCQCPPGYELGPDGHLCHDLDECAAEAPCEHQCENTEGSFLCRCHLGFSPSEEEPGQCADTDECQFPGVCQQMCVNYVGGFECYCTEGYELDADGISCVLVAQLPPLATAEGYRPYESGHGWPPQHDGSALSDRFPVFQDIRVGSPELEAPSSFLPDPRVVPRMVPEDTEPPDVSATPRDSVPLLRHPDPATLDRHETPDPTSAATGTPSGPATGFALSSPKMALRDPQTPDAHPASATTRPAPQPDLTSFPEVGGGAVVWGVRAAPPTFTTPSQTLQGDSGQRKRDDRWLLVALLVPICVFVVIMLVLGIVYCTRCGPQAKARSVTQCYRWVISSAGKGAAPPSRPGQPATCRTSV